MNRFEEIKKLYEDIKQNTYTLWDNGYPSDELISYDIERGGLWGVFDESDTLIAISFAGERNEDGEEGYTWNEDLKRRGTFARIGVSPKHQHKGVATKLVAFILDELKRQGFDGVRIMVGVNNINAQKLYNKFGFKNAGNANRYGHDYYLYELKFN